MSTIAALIFFLKSFRTKMELCGPEEEDRSGFRYVHSSVGSTWDKLKIRLILVVTVCKMHTPPCTVHPPVIRIWMSAPTLKNCLLTNDAGQWKTSKMTDRCISQQTAVSGHRGVTLRTWKRTPETSVYEMKDKQRQGNVLVLHWQGACSSTGLISAEFPL